MARVAKGLRDIDAVRKQVLYYKPDAMTYAEVYSENSSGEVAIYQMKPPYEELIVRDEALATVRKCVATLQQPRSGSS